MGKFVGWREKAEICFNTVNNFKIFLVKWIKNCAILFKITKHKAQNASETHNAPSVIY